MSSQTDSRCIRFDVETLESRQMMAATTDYNLGLGGRIATHTGNSGIYWPTDSIAQPDGKLILSGLRADLAGVAIIRFNKDGSLDRSFAADGQVWLDLGAEFDVQVQRDGRILVGGDKGIARLKRNGTSDHSFGHFGFVPTPRLGRDKHGVLMSIDPSDMEMLPDGKILVAGLRYGSTLATVLIRYNSDGRLDRSFGRSGYRIIHNQLINPLDLPRIGLQKDGKIVIGSRGFGDGDAPVTRLNPNGSLDKTFGTEGYFQLPGVSIDELLVQPDGKIIVDSVPKHDDPNYAYIMRLNADGSVDQDFNQRIAPYASTGNEPHLPVIRPDGTLLIGTYKPTDSPGPFNKGPFGYWAFGPHGSIDTSFGRDGFLSAPTQDIANDPIATVFSDGGLAISFRTNPPETCTAPAYPCPFATDIITGRYRPNGSIIASFGQFGRERIRYLPDEPILSTAPRRRHHAWYD